MSTTYTDAKIIWGSEAGQDVRVFPTGKDFSSAVVTYPTAAAPYFAVTLSGTNKTTTVVESQNLTVIRPG